MVMCGIAAYYGPNAPLNTYKLLVELQHRGQESAGISILSKNSIETIVRPGYVLTAISPNEVSRLDSQVAIGHVRYSTTGEPGGGVGAQPITLSSNGRSISLAFNGNIINYRDLSKEFLNSYIPSDAEVLARLVLKLYEELGDVVEAVKNLASLVRGSYSLVVLTPEPRVVIARDPWGFKPLTYSFSGDVLAVASESSALEVLGFDSWSEVGPGTIVSFDGKSLEVVDSGVRGVFSPCVFEYVYFSRPDSVFNGVQVHEARVRMGMHVGGMDNVDVDVVIPVPDSGRSAALGYSIVRKVLFDEGLIRNRYAGRSFITTPDVRDFISDVKYGVIKSVVCGRRVAVVDDSLIRGTTMERIVKILKCRGVKEVHVRVASPPVKYPCFMGVDFPTRRELIASRYDDVDSISKYLGADSLLYNTVEGLRWAVKLPSLCLACYTGVYPFKDINIEVLEKVFSRW
jgi:amidophosphoribosyltransferase